MRLYLQLCEGIITDLSSQTCQPPSTAYFMHSQWAEILFALQHSPAIEVDHRQNLPTHQKCSVGSVGSWRGKCHVGELTFLQALLYLHLTSHDQHRPHTHISCTCSHQLCGVLCSLTHAYVQGILSSIQRKKPTVHKCEDRPRAPAYYTAMDLCSSQANER